VVNRAFPILIVAALPLAGCGPDFVPGSVLDGLRVLALAPERPDAAPGETVTVRALVSAPAGEAITESWSFCPLTLGPSAAYRCVSSVCEYPVASATPREVSADPSAYAIRCLEELGGTLPADPGGGTTLPPQVETVFTYRARTASGERTAVARVPLFTSAASVPAEAQRNHAPAITSVSVAASSGRPGDRIPITVEVDPTSLETYLDGTGRALTEQVTVFFYTTAGRFPDGEDLDVAPHASTALELRELRDTDVEAQVYVVVRDLRGGQAFRGPFTVAIDRSP
jgi:hypothetical protein